jgi:hypothetical protein
MTEMNAVCQRHCFSTLNHNLAYCYNDQRVIKWLWKLAKSGFQEEPVTSKIRYYVKKAPDAFGLLVFFRGSSGAFPSWGGRPAVAVSELVASMRSRSPARSD